MLPADQSIASRIASLNPQHKQKILALLSDSEKDGLMWDWRMWARPKQKAPAWNWLVWLVLAGRGFGKTRTGAEQIRIWKDNYPVIHLIGPTAGDVRDVMVEGPAGILAVSPPGDRPHYEPSKRRLTWENGAMATCFSADEPDRLRGPQCHKAWADEPAAWRFSDAWDQMMFGLRLGDNPQVVATTTPRPTAIIKDLVKRDGKDVAVTRGTTWENSDNLAASFFSTVIRKYEGTRLGRQELEAQILEDVEGALWTMQIIEQSRLQKSIANDMVVIGVDPPAKDRLELDVSEEEKLLNAECGIVAVGANKPVGLHNGKTPLPHGYVRGDYSMEGTPEQWGRAVVNAFNNEMADAVIAEANQGGAMVRSVIHNVDPSVPVQLVYASRGKRTRAEPISAMYEQGRIHHIGYFPELEAQMTTWVPGDKSPDRMDACLVAGTLVTTDSGERPIEQIVPGDRVLTREGYRSVLHSGCTNHDAPTVTVELSNGRTITGTGNHPAWIEGRGFVPMDTLICGDIILQCEGVKTSGSMESSTLDSLIAKTSTSETISGRHARAGSRRCTVKYGKSITVLFLPESRFTTKTTTRRTTNHPISNALHVASMRQNTRKSTGTRAERGLILSDRSPQSGTALRRAERGIPSTVSRSRPIRSQSRLSALSAVAVPSDFQSPALGRSVVGNAPGLQLTAKSDTSWLSPAPSAVIDSTRTSTEPSPPHAPVFVVRVYASGRAPVFNIEVEDQPEYFANGVLVHNCVWALTKLLIGIPRSVGALAGRAR